MAKYCRWMLVVGFLCCPLIASAALPSEELLPDTTKGYVSIPNVEMLRTKWNETQLGRLVQDPVMRPFVDDLRNQIKNKLSKSRVSLGLTLDDLSDIYGGELCLAVTQPANDESQHATVILVDITGHEAQAKALVAKVTKNLLAQGVKQKNETISDAAATVLQMPKKRPDAAVHEALYVIHKDMLVVTDRRDLCQHIVGRLNGKKLGTLSQVPAFIATMERCASGAGDMQPHIRWFVEPLGYAQVARAEAGGRKKRGVDLLKVLPHQGFDALQGVGGHVLFATGDQEVLHRTLVYAPPVKREAGDSNPERYNLAARMLDFPNTDTLQPQPFVGRDLGGYVTFNWKMIEAFEYSKTLVNELLQGGPDTDLLEDIIVSLAKDKDGPQVDLRKDLIHHFAQRASLITDCRRPITPDSERLLVAIELTNPEAVQQTLNKAFESDPDAEKREFEGQVIWEIVTDDSPVDVEEIKIEGAGFNPFDLGENEQVVEEEEKKILPNSALTVAHGHLIVASHVDFVVDLLKRPLGSDVLSDAADYQQIEDALSKIGAGTDSFRFFTRTDEAYRPTYELIKQGRMPEAKTVLGKLLNRVLGPDEKGILREQQIDGGKMPEFDAVRRYLGPSGGYIRSDDDGWFIAGCLLSKDVP
ncbi:MAG: hypothetical protein GXY58_10930 [Planctomycetaceae bacterium]|nr:hypothetical protein [Planctomycetaceae bacterium]